MRSLIRCLILVLTVVITLVVTGCGEKPDAELEKILKKKKENTVITLYYPEDNSAPACGETPGRSMKATLKGNALDKLNEILSKDLGITLNPVPLPKYPWEDKDKRVQYQGYNTQLLQYLELGQWKVYDASDKDTPYMPSENAADMFFMDNELFYHAAKAGVLADIGELLPEHAPGLFGKYDPQRLSSAKHQGRLLYLPNLMEDSLRYYFVIREDLLRTVGMATVETFEDYERFMAKIRETMPDITPGAISTEVRTNSAYTWVYAFCIPVDLFSRPFAESRGYVFVDEYLDLAYEKNDPDRLLFWKNTQESSEAEEVVKRWEESRYIKAVEAETFEAQQQFDDNTAELFVGKLASCIGTWQQAMRINDILLENKLSHLRVKAFPVYPQNVAVKISPASFSMGFYAHSPNINKCLELLGWIQQSQVHYDLFMYGVKGEDYNLIGDQLDIPVARIPELADTAFDWRKAMANWKYLRTNASSPPSQKEDLLQTIVFQTQYAVYEGWMPDLSALNIPLSMPGVSGSCPIYDRERWFINMAVLRQGSGNAEILFSENSLNRIQKQWDEQMKE
jgi:maltose-binding protein MalE